MSHEKYQSCIEACYRCAALRNAIIVQWLV